MTGMELRDIIKDFTSREGAVVRALDGITLDIAPEGITCLVGPTGSGKTMLLRIVAGLERADAGSVLVNGEPPEGQGSMTGYLTQHHTLFPWMHVRGNIGLPLVLRRTPEDAVRKRVAEICAMLGLAGAEERYPHELSGGMQQRAALGRLLASDSGIWLLDEPFSALDERTRHHLQNLLLELAGKDGRPVLFVTHSIDEAVFLADRVVVLSAGPGRIAETVDIALARPRNRLSPEYGRLIEKVRTRIESVL